MILLAAYLLMGAIVIAADWWIRRQEEELDDCGQALWDELYDASEQFLRQPDKHSRQRLERAIEDLG